MLLVGLTGGLASGKTTVARLLVDHGAAVRDADSVVRWLYLPGHAGTAAVVALFGEEVLTAAGGVDHPALAARVLADDGARRALEQAIHPLVRAEIEKWFGEQQAKEAPPAIAIVEAALLVETGYRERFHRLVTVSAAEALRRARAAASGWSAAAIERVLAAQLDDAGRERVADYVVRNDGGAGELRAAVGELWPALRRDAALLAAGQPLPPLRHPDPERSEGEGPRRT